MYPTDGEAAIKAYGNFHKWTTSRPTRKDGPAIFFDDLARTLECDEAVTGVMLIDTTLDEFISLLNPEKQAMARAALKIGPTADLPELAKAAAEAAQTGNSDMLAVANSLQAGRLTYRNFKRMLVQHRGHIESIKNGIAAGRINQRHYYLSPEAAVAWNNLVRAEAYPTYDQCKSGLRALTETKEWQTAIAQHRPRTVVMLAGGGAPSKDMVLIKALLEQVETGESDRLDYYLFDISPYMLFTSMWWLEESLATTSKGRYVNIHPVVVDVLELRNTLDTLPHGGNTLFAMTGGTLGNMSEAAMFSSLNAISQVGDLLVLSAGTIDSGSIADARGELVRKYNHPDMQEFILPAVRALMSEFDLGENKAAVFSRVDVDVKDGKADGLSDLDDVASVKLSLSVAGRNITLLSSARYKSEKLIAFAKSRGWRHITTQVSPLSPNFSQFLFERKLT